MTRTLLSWAAAVLASLFVGDLAQAQFISTFATPLPHGPGTVPMTLPAAPMAAPVLMPIGALTAAPVGVYQFPGPVASRPDVGGWGDEHAEGAPTGGRVWAFADHLYGASKGAWLPPLVTAARPAVPLGMAGALHSPGTVVLFGGERVNNDFRSGMRAGGGYWFGADRRRGVDGSVFFLGESGERYAAASGPGGPTVARPLVAGFNGQNFGLPVAGPFPGGVTASADTFIIGTDVNYRRAVGMPDAGCGGGPGRFDLLVGYRYVHLGDTVDVWQASAPGPLAAVLPGVGGALVHDSFHTRNHFHGPQVGAVLARDLARCGLSLELLAKVAFGVTVSEADVVGTARAPGLAAVPLGVLVGPSNAGAYEDTHFAVVPEVGAKLGCQVWKQLRVTTGYSFLYWSAVRRAPSLIDLTVLAPGRPAVRDRIDDLWVQGWTIGAEWWY